MSLVMKRPDSTEYAAYYDRYIALVAGDDVLPALATQRESLVGFLRSVPESQGDVRHAPYTWTVKQVVGHVTDTERVFAYRALRFARGDATPLPGFDEQAYARAAELDHLLLADVVSEFEAVRRSNEWLFRGFSKTAWLRKGEANENLVSVRALAYIIVGHAAHHGAILRKRLGPIG